MDKQLPEYEQRRCATLLSGDLSGLRSLLDEDLVYTHSNGHAQSLDEYLQFLASGVRYVEVKWSSFRVDTYAPLTRIAGTMAIAGIRPGATETTRIKPSALALWLDRGQGPRLFAFQATLAI
jgi:hypothetical protein